MKVRDTNHIANFHIANFHYFFLCDKANGFVADLSQTLSQTSLHVEMVCVCDFHNMCPRLSSWGSFGESRRNGIWALVVSAAVAVLVMIIIAITFIMQPF